MASKLRKAKIESFAGGLNVYSNATQVEDAESPDLLNVDFSGIGSVKKRSGYTKLTTSEVNTGDRIQGIYSYITTSVREILYIADGTLYKYDGSGGSTAITGGTFSTTADVNAAQIGTRLYFFDGATALSYYDGSNVSTTGVASAPTYPTQGIFYNKRLYCNSTANKDRVYFGGALTSTGAATDTGNFGTGAPSYGGFLGFGEGREVVGFAKLGTSLYVFLKDSIQRIDPVANTGVSSTLDHTSTMISNSIGCRAPRSIENVGNDVYFLDSTVYSLGEIANFTSLRTTNVSAKVAKLFAGMTQTAIEKAAAIYYTKEEVYLLAIQVDGSGYNDHVVGFSLPYKAWFYWDSMKVNHWLEFIDSDDVKHLYFGSDNDAASYVYEAYQGLNDDGAAINAYYFTKEFDLKEFDIEKLFQFWSVQFGGIYGEVTVDTYVEGSLADTITLTSGTSSNSSDGWGTSLLGTFLWGVEGSFTEASSTDPGLNNDWRYHDLGGLEGTTFQFKFSNATVNQGFEIKQATVSYLPFGPYKRDSEKEV